MPTVGIERRKSDRGRGHALLSRIPVAILQGPFEFCVAILSAMIGVGVIITSFLQGADFTTIQSELPIPIVIAWSAFLVVGGIGVVASIFRRDKNKRFSLSLEIASLVLMSTGWLVYGLAPLFATGRLSVIVVAGCILTASALRIHAISLAVKIARETQDILSRVR